MTEEELKKKCTERAKIFQQAMESCHSSSPIDCIEWFADRIAELEKENAELKETLRTYNGCGDWDNDFHSCRVYLQYEELQKCMEQLTKAKDHIRKLLDCLQQDTNDPQTNYYVIQYITKAEQFLKEVEQ